MYIINISNKIIIINKLLYTMCDKYDRIVTLKHVFSKINKEKDMIKFAGELQYNDEPCGTLF